MEIASQLSLTRRPARLLTWPTSQLLSTSEVRHDCHEGTELPSNVRQTTAHRVSVARHGIHALGRLLHSECRATASWRGGGSRACVTAVGGDRICTAGRGLHASVWARCGSL